MGGIYFDCLIKKPADNALSDYVLSLSYLRRILTPCTDKKWGCDYYAKKDGVPLRSPYFGILPSTGTYLINDDFIKIDDNGWSHILALTSAPYENDRRYDYFLYKLKDECQYKKLIDLTEDDFYLLHHKYIDKTTIEKLPFGTYMLKYRASGPTFRPCIISIEKD